LSSSTAEAVYCDVKSPDSSVEIRPCLYRYAHKLTPSPTESCRKGVSLLRFSKVYDTLLSSLFFLLYSSRTSFALFPCKDTSSLVKESSFSFIRFSVSLKDFLRFFYSFDKRQYK